MLKSLEQDWLNVTVSHFPFKHSSLSPTVSPWTPYFQLLPFDWKPCLLKPNRSGGSSKSASKQRQSYLCVVASAICSFLRPIHSLFHSSTHLNFTRLTRKTKQLQRGAPPLFAWALLPKIDGLNDEMWAERRGKHWEHQIFERSGAGGKKEEEARKQQAHSAALHTYILLFSKNCFDSITLLLVGYWLCALSVSSFSLKNRRRKDVGEKEEPHHYRTQPEEVLAGWVWRLHMIVLWV